MLSITRSLGLGLLVWATIAEPASSPRGPWFAVLLAAAAVAWVGWLFAWVRRRPLAVVAVVALLGAAGGALVPWGAMALAFVGVAGMDAGIAFELPGALALSAVGPVAVLCSAAFGGQPLVLALDGALVALAGLVVGMGRRQAVGRAEHDSLIAIEAERAEVERARASVLAERNRLAREIHDVLAHTLGALSVQLEALEAVSGSEPVAPAVRGGLERTRQLVGAGLEEARQAVQALREDPIPLAEGLAALCVRTGAVLEVSGEPRLLVPEVSLALYRVAQEALANAVKHAPGAGVIVRLDFGSDAVGLVVLNEGATRPQSGSALGAGYGLQGIRERVLLLSGQVDAGPHGDGWRVETRIPA